MTKLRYGIIATGGIAEKFARTAPLVEDIALTAVASRSIEKAQAFAEKYGIEKAYGSYQELFDDPDVDAVYIATPHNFHKENCIDAANAGKHILCEKAMALNVAEVKEMFAAAEKNNVFLMEAMWTRFIPTTVKAREWVEAGLIGDVRFMSVPFGNYRAYDPESRLFHPGLAGGATYDLGVYPIEFILDFTKGKEIEDIKSFVVNNPSGTDSTMNAIIAFDDGAQAQLFCSFECATNHETYIYGTKGYIKMDTFQCPKMIELYIDGELRDVYEISFDSGFEFEMQHTVDCIREGRITSPIMTPEDTLTSAELFEKILGK
ncbi:MAG: Gfo/Idh/MocA family protein [Christensenellaceae bacterium]|jgi:dihydrodiol dehydrogenase / D-xylose 1-dehydrogenase (NADP)